MTPITAASELFEPSGAHAEMHAGARETAAGALEGACLARRQAVCA